MTKNQIKHSKREKAVLALTDGTVFEGYGFGKGTPWQTLVAGNDDHGGIIRGVGEVVFNTSLYGYQEILTDPSYHGQIMTFTYPHIGNVGCNENDNESDEVHVAALLARSPSSCHSNWRATESLDDFLVRNGVMGMGGFDTRALVKHIRDKGAQTGAVALVDGAPLEKVKTALIDFARSHGDMTGKDYVQKVGASKRYDWKTLPFHFGERPSQEEAEKKIRLKLVVLDCGVKRNILSLLFQAGFEVLVVPPTSTIEEIQELQPEALFFSNGPGDPATQKHLVDLARFFRGKLPLLGICLGHQIIGQALGAKTYKLQFGHRGGNHPVMNLQSNKIEITVQNHGFAVHEEGLQKDWVSHINLNDRTVEGIYIEEEAIYSIQYHPEASPGPHDSEYLFDDFYKCASGFR